VATYLMALLVQNLQLCNSLCQIPTKTSTTKRLMIIVSDYD